MRENSRHFESSPIDEEQWREFLTSYFKSNKKSITKFVMWLLNNRYYSEQLELKNQKPENIADDIVQNLFLKLQREGPISRQNFLKEDQGLRNTIFNNQVRWAVNNYFEKYPVAGPRGRGMEYSHTDDVYQKKDLKLIGFEGLEERDVESSELKDEISSFPKSRISLPFNETNPYILAEKQELAEKLDAELKTLTKREEKILRMHFGLPPYEREYILDEIAEDEDVTRENKTN